MDRINSFNMAAGRKWQDANPGVGQEATAQNAEWHNGVQEELIGIIIAAGLVPTAGVYNQVLTAIQQFIAAAAAPNASTTQYGLVELATNAQAAALTDTTHALTPSGLGSLFGRSLTTNGYQKLPGGLILQWGSITTSGTGGGAIPLTFPVTFPSACLYGNYVGNGFDNVGDSTSQVSSYSSPGNGLPEPNGMSIRLTNNAATLLWFALGN